MNVELAIRHGSSLCLRNCPWYVAVQEVPEPLLGRPVLQALGLDTRATLEAASIEHDGVVDLAQILSPEELKEGTIARVVEGGIFHQTAPKLNAIEEDLPVCEIGVDDKEEIDDAFKELIRSAKENGFKRHEELGHLLKKHRGVFRCRLGHDPPAKVEPINVSLQKDARPVRCKVRSYSNEQRNVMKEFIDNAVEMGYLRKNANSTWTAAPLLVPKPYPKPGAAKYRIAFDLRHINLVTVPQSWPMPQLDSELQDMQDTKCYAVMDFTSSYWQMPLNQKSQEFHSVITPFGVFSPTRTLQGARNSAANFQSRVEPCFNSINERVKAWLDDFILFTRSEQEHLETLDSFLRICGEVGLKVSPRKSKLFVKEAKWCGRVISAKGMRMDPRHAEGLAKTHKPLTADELSQFLNCTQWMSQCILDFAARVQPLRDMLEKAYEEVGKQKTNAIRKIPVSSLGWNSNHSAAFDWIQQSLKNAVWLAHMDAKKPLCIFTDASDQHWAAVVTQCAEDDLQKPIGDQRHIPLAFLGAQFTGASQDWSTIEKEGFAIYQTFKKLDYLLMASDNTRLYTDHSNLLYVFHPRSMEPGLGRHVVSKLQRWALYLSQFQYCIEHIRGELNVMPDIMTRWYKGYRGSRAKPEKRMVRRLVIQHEHVQSPLSEDFTKPKSEDIACVQEKFKNQAPQESVLKENLLYFKDKIWVPDEGHELQSKILVLGHCGKVGHRGSRAKASMVKECFTWSNLEQDCAAFVRNCIHCITAFSGNSIPRPFAGTLHAKKPNEILHFDYLYMGKGLSDFWYLLLLKDNFSGYAWLVPFKKANAENAAQAISNWISTFTPMQAWVSDQGSHFKNEILEILRDSYHIHHHFTVAYSPWCIGTVERRCSEVLRVVKVIHSERKWAPQDWPRLVKLAQAVINEAPLERLGKREDGTFRTLLEVMTGDKPNRDLFAVEKFNFLPDKESPSSIQMCRKRWMKCTVTLKRICMQIESGHVISITSTQISNQSTSHLAT